MKLAFPCTKWKNNHYHLKIFIQIPGKLIGLKVFAKVWQVETNYLEERKKEERLREREERERERER